MIAIGLALCALWALAIFGAQPRESARHGQATEPSALIGVLIVLALLVGIVVQHRKQRDDED